MDLARGFMACLHLEDSTWVRVDLVRQLHGQWRPPETPERRTDGHPEVNWTVLAEIHPSLAGHETRTSDLGVLSLK